MGGAGLGEGLLLEEAACGSCALGIKGSATWASPLPFRSPVRGPGRLCIPTWLSELPWPLSPAPPFCPVCPELCSGTPFLPRGLWLGCSPCWRGPGPSSLFKALGYFLELPQVGHRESPHPPNCVAPVRALAQAAGEQGFLGVFLTFSLAASPRGRAQPRGDRVKGSQ